MKPIYLQKHTQSGENSFAVQYAEVPYTYNKFHCHKEFELIYHIENSGTRFVGDSINRFENGDLVLVGPNIPHYWHSDDAYFKGDPHIKAKLVSIHFIENFVGDAFMNLPEMFPMRDILTKAKRGIRIRGKAAPAIGRKIMDLPNIQGHERMLKIIDILCSMGDAPEYELLASPAFSERLTDHDKNEKISRIFNFMAQNYHHNIELHEVANYAHMNPSAFCRYFKKATSKTFSEMLNEIRIGFACKMLIDTTNSISEIGYSCGYMNIPYFNRQFKMIKSMSPLQYRNLHQNKGE